MSVALPRARTSAAPPSRQGSWRERLGNSPWPWLVPAGLLLLLVFAYPIVEIVRLSFTNAGLAGGDFEYSLSSYTQLFGSPGFTTVLVVTAIFVAASVVFQMLLGLAIAQAVKTGQDRGLRGTVVARTAVLSAWAIPGVIVGVTWGLLYQQSEAGVLKYLLGLVGIDSVAFLSDPTTALISVIVANVWRGTALSMILLYAALQTVDRDVIEAARVDGAGPWQRFRHVVLPAIAPVVLINLVIVTVDTFNTFDMVLALTGGGPGQSTEVLALSIFTQIFQRLQLGEGAATAVVLLLINLVMTLAYLRAARRAGAGEE
jgi:multiple sugar transport system permease protein